MSAICSISLTSFLIGHVLAFILKEWQLTYGQSALILISAGVGAVLGGFFWGWMGDRIGRRKVFILTALNVAFATGIMSFTPDPGRWVSGWIFLSFFRFFVGFGNAGLIAVDIPLVQEFVPTYERGWVSGLTTDLLPAGNILRGAVGMAAGARDRLAGSVPRRPGPRALGADDPLLGAGVAALADAHGADGGGAQIARLGAAGGPERDRAADQPS
jgi:MFS family permease